ncbi:hypothetical protein [Nonomuraea ceibae]|uniref:hypothetical protein n=1 Tax=Nonomuraea ceibae TaxID=1935170 RepID=UPI001C5F45AE|nr:hypothetical protein [Nonomuraea ceibae]
MRKHLLGAAIAMIVGVLGFLAIPSTAHAITAAPATVTITTNEGAASNSASQTLAYRWYKLAFYDQDFSRCDKVGRDMIRAKMAVAYQCKKEPSPSNPLYYGWWLHARMWDDDCIARRDITTDKQADATTAC